MWSLASDAICRAKSLQVQQGLIALSATNQLLQLAAETLCVCGTEVSLNPASFDYFRVETSHASFVIVRGSYRDSAYALHMLSVMVRLQSCLFEAWQLLEPSIRLSHTSYISHTCKRQRPPTRLGQFINPHPRLCKPSQAVHYRVGNSAHHPAWFVILTEFAKLSIFFIIFRVIRMLLIVWTCTIAQTVSNRIQHLQDWFLGHCRCRSHRFSITDIVVLLNRHFLCAVNLLSCHISLSIYIILDSFLFFFCA